MPAYPYVCPNCDHSFDVIKRMKFIDSTEKCRKCGTHLDKNHRKIATQTFRDEKVEDITWDMALGCYVKSNKHRRQIAKSRGLEEVGNEPLDNMIKHYEKQREDTAKARWAEFYEPIEVRSR